HFFYRIGGWPDLESGSLTLAHVPYAFKPCLFREAAKLGYRKILWLDVSIRPMKSLDYVFHTLEEQGYFFYPSGTNLAPFCTQQAADFFGITAEEARKMPSLAGGIVGLNVEHSAGQQVLEMWM